MTACGVCVSSHSGSNECTGYRNVKVRAGQPWQCSECGKVISRGERYELASWFYADHEGFDNAKTCLVCAEIADAFQCNGRWHGGSFWDDMEDVWASLTTSCFDRLQSPAAKAELQRRWMEWKGLL